MSDASCATALGGGFAVTARTRKHCFRPQTFPCLAFFTPHSLLQLQASARACVAAEPHSPSQDVHVSPPSPPSSPKPQDVHLLLQSPIFRSSTRRCSHNVSAAASNPRTFSCLRRSLSPAPGRVCGAQKPPLEPKPQDVSWGSLWARGGRQADLLLLAIV